eukprot:gene9020-1349_t
MTSNFMNIFNSAIDTGNPSKYSPSSSCCASAFYICARRQRHANKQALLPSLLLAGTLTLPPLDRTSLTAFLFISSSSPDEPATMAIGKNKRLTKGKKGSKKKVVDVMTKKEWYDIKAPAYFNQRQVGKTLVTRSSGTKLAADGLRGRVFEVALGDLNGDDNMYRKIRLVCEDVYGRDLLLNFHGMDLTTDKLRSLVKKWQTLIQTFVDIKTSDGYTLRVFCIGFTKKQKNSVRKTAYAQTSQIKAIRAKMRDVIQNESTNCDLKQFVGRLITDEISREIEKSVKSIYPLHNVFLRKVKVLKKPRADTAKLYELHGIIGKKSGKSGKSGSSKPTEFAEPKPLESV